MEQPNDGLQVAVETLQDNGIEVDVKPTWHNPERLELFSFRKHEDKLANPFAKVNTSNAVSDTYDFQTGRRLTSTTQVAPDGELVEVKCGEIGPHYLLLEHEDIWRKMQSVMDNSGIEEWVPTWELTTKGAAVWVKIMVGKTDPVILPHNGVDHEYYPTLAGINSYDGTQKARFLMGAYDSICLNLSRNGWDFASFEIRHTKGNLSDWNKQMDAMEEMMSSARGDLQRYVEKLILMQSIEVNTPVMNTLWNKVYRQFPDKFNVEVLDRFYSEEAETHTLFDLFQASTAVLSEMKKARLADMNRNDIVSRDLHKFLAEHLN
jgi:hypothetical protein